MNIKKYKDFYYVESELLKKYNIPHMFSTIKCENISDMNFSFTHGNLCEKSIDNYKRVADFFNVPLSNIVKSCQIHEDVVFKIDKKHLGMGITKESEITNADGIYTDMANVPLCIFSADCVPILICDKNKTVVSAVHSGWKGTAKEISKNAINIISEKYNVKKEDIVCAIGPAIGGCCYEVSFDVTDELKKVVDISDCCIKKDNGKFLIDLKLINKKILIKNGISKENIDMCNMCTKCMDEYFYSYRRQGIKAGRNAGFVMI